MTIKVSKALLRHAENAFIVLALFLFSQALLNSNKLPWAAANEILRGVGWIGVYGTTFFLGISRWKQLVWIATRDKLLLLLLGIALVSVLWSEAPKITLAHTITLITSSLFGAYLVARYSLKEQLQLLAWMYGIAVLLSLFFTLVFPQYGVSAAGWQGVYQQSNILARHMYLGFIVFYLTVSDKQRYRWVAWSGIGIAVALLLGTRSATGIVTLLTTVFLLPLYKALRWNDTITIPLYIIVILITGGASTWFLDNLEGIFAILGKDPTFTGRVPLWDAVFNQMIPKHFWLGYGYDGFWTGSSATTGYIYQIFAWQPSNAHNLYLDIWLSLGLLGLTVFVLGFLMCCLRAAAYARSTKTGEGLWPLLYLTFIFLYSPVQSIIPGSNNIFWIIYVAVTLSTHIRPDQASKHGVGS